jgi:hypothetical protein
MQHHDDIRAVPQRFEIAGLLVAAVAPVRLVHDGVDPQGTRDDGRGVVGGVVGEDDLIDHVVGNRFVRAPQRPLRAERGHHHDDPLTVEHG